MICNPDRVADGESAETRESKESRQDSATLSGLNRTKRALETQGGAALALGYVRKRLRRHMIGMRPLRSAASPRSPRATRTVLFSRYALRPSSPSSRPMPDIL